MTLEEAANRIHMGRSIAFFGAAFSRGAKGEAGAEMTAGSGLAETLSNALGEPSPLPLDLAAQEYVRSNLQPDIRDLIKRSYTASAVTPAQQALATLPWMRCYTTNYDDVVEHAREQTRQPFDSATSLDSPIDFSGRFSIVHLHGFVRRVTLDDWDSTFVLTNEQYAADILRESGWLETFRNDVSYATSIFFFGYSMQDLDIARLMYANPALAEKTFIIAGSKPSRPTEVRTQGYGQLVRMSVEDAADLFPVAGDPKAAKPSPYTVALVPMSSRAADDRPSREVVVNYLVKGDFAPAYAARDLVNGTSEYFVSRDAINLRAETFGVRPERLLVHSNLGAGKTSALFELAHYALTAGWSVFNLVGGEEGFEYDVDYLASLTSDEQKRTLIFVENCFAHTERVKDLLARFPLLSLVLTTRSAVLQTRIGGIEEAFGEDFEVVELNELTPDEAKEIDTLLLNNGLWGERQGDSSEKRLRYIQIAARSDLPTLLVDVCRSSDIFARIKVELNEIESHPRELRKSLVVTLCLTLTGARLNLGQICEVVEADLFKLGQYQANPAIKEFIDFERGRVVARSATFARAVLREIIPDRLILESIPAIIARLDRLRLDHDIYDEPFKGLMRFGLIESVISSEGKEAKLVAFYEAIRATGVTANNPQFWLQYAIACMSFGDYKNAGEHFTAAFGLAGSKGGYDPYQIENQYARFLLESRLHSSGWSDHFEVFKQAHDIIARQMNSFQEGFYPYRVARLYLPFIEANIKAFSRDQRQRIVEWCDQLLKLAEGAPPRIRRSRYWREATDALKHARDYLGS